MADLVLDASALLVWLFDEPGAEVVGQLLRERCVVSSVNLAEVVTKMLEDGVLEPEARATVADLQLEVVDFDEECAWKAAGLSARPGRSRRHCRPRLALAGPGHRSPTGAA